MDKNRLIYGDNLEELRAFDDEVVDLVYLDPPFNSNRSYNVLFANQSGDDAQAQIEAFDDTWTWSHESEQQYQELVDGDYRVSDAIEAMRKIVGTNDVLAYLVMMTPRLVELHRVLKPTGMLYLHCDPTAGHYLKIILDSIFGPDRFVNEIVWKRTSAHNRVTRFGPVHDLIYAYAKSDERTWNPVHVPYDDDYVERFYRHVEEGTGRRYRLSDLTSNNPGNRELFQGEPPPGTRYWGYAITTLERFADEGRIIYSKNGYPQYKRYLDEMPGQLVQDVWTDINPLSTRSSERLGYPTQKPLELLHRLIAASSNEGDVVLDPFCGCGTTVDAAQQLGRRWIGIDITYLAVDLIDKRLRDTHGDAIMDTYTIEGTPHDMAGAQALFEANPFDFERWAVSMVHGQPNQKQVGDRGVDGRIKFALELTKAGTLKKSDTAIISVKGGKTIGPGMVRDLDGAVRTENAAIGVLILMSEPTKGMKQAEAKGGTYTWSYNQQQFPRIQIITVQQLLDGEQPKIPPALANPYKQAKTLFDNGAEAQSLF